MYKFRTAALRRLIRELGEEQGVSMRSMLDLGVGDGCQFRMLLPELPMIQEYVGLDVSKTIVSILQDSLTSGDLLRGNSWQRPGGFSASFYHYDGYDVPAELFGLRFDIVLSLQVVMHILADALFDAYMRLLFSFAGSYIIIHGDNEESPQENHVRGWRFTTWIEKEAPEWDLIDRVPFEQFCPTEVHDRKGDSLWVYARKRSF
eukprot:TRINITY_DN2845_c0_g1_i4.p1 TRINITY_DN2845_c0_g1~~TRINITY_DN2845_c0_g1_i4.p1  ORF type:complete len:204 (-),score=30.12 TRINITY_DN2845_c0_g1_i4:109-720(-)